MNTLNILILKSLRKIYSKIFPLKKIENFSCEKNPDKASEIIYQQLISDEPCMIARFGAFELNTVVNYLGIMNEKKSVWKYIKGDDLPWWWNKKLFYHMTNNAGFFPTTEEKIETFCKLILEDIKQLDVLGSWLNEEIYFEESLKECKKVHLMLLEPFWADIPWTRALENKKILVVHPFSETILSQYEKRANLFDNSDILPNFTSLNVIKAVSFQDKDKYVDWFDALEHMKKQIDNSDYDICLIGAGAYGFPLAAHVKRTGKKAIHLGGALQLLFGIIGKRWEDPTYGVEKWNIPFGAYSSLIKESWVRPLNIEKPKTAENIEGACYW